MRYGSVCSGIEAASVAWHNLGWEAQWYSEIEHFPSEVLKHRFPDVPNLGDMTQLTSNPIFNEKSINLLVGGTPCQSFSVAGLRGGLADPRGNLMLTFLALADTKKPKWIVWENVPGVLSSNGGKDFGTFLGALGELGYGFAYRVLDAQHFGVAQRRRRVFVVGYLGDWRPAAAVLFESESLQRDSKPSRTKRQETPYDAQKCVGTTSPDGRETIGTLRQRDYKGIGNDDLESGRGLAIQIKDVSCAGGNVSPTVTSKWKTGYGKPSGRSEADNMVYEPQYFDNHAQDSRVTGPHDVGSTVSANYGMGGGNTPIVGQPTAQPIALASKQYSQNIGINIANPLLADDYKEPQVIAQPIAVDTPTIIDRAAFNQGKNAQYEPRIEQGQTMSSLVAKGPHAVQHTMAIRRLTPKECERLQGFPDDWTRIPYRNKPADQCPDGPRYKACGNSMAVPVMRWIGKRIQKIETLLNEK